jgi:hypothetical protein
MKTAFTIAVLAIPALALCQERVLPNDALIGGLDNIYDIKKVAPNIYEFTRLADVPGAMPGTTAPTMCLGAALAYMKGYPGMSIGAVDDGIPSGRKATLTVALLKAQGEMSSLPTTLRWLGYFDLKALHKPCEEFIGQRYMWPAG